MRGLLLMVLVSSMACHRNRSALDAVPKYRLDGAYAFTVNGEGVYMSGYFVVADTQVFLDVARTCEPAAAPKASDGMRASWFDCNRTREGGFLQLRISEVDPVNRSRWYARMRVPDTVTRCTQYTTTGVCTQVVRARGMKWVDRHGTMVVTRGLPGTPPDTGRSIEPTGSRRLRIRCDTSAAGQACSSDLLKQ
jgi:hypothetical protein